MVKITCQACGRRYDYAKEGLCPNCGAYNRPPRRETVDANGEIHHLNITEEMTPPQGKVCYEAQECHEDAVRKVRPRKSGGYRKRSLPHEKIAAKASDYSGKKKKAQMIAIGAALLSVVTTLIGNLTAKSETVFPEPEGSIAQAEERVQEIMNESIFYIETDCGWFGITDWQLKDWTWEIDYISEFNPQEWGTIKAMFRSADGEEYSLSPNKSTHYDWGKKQGGSLTYTANHEEDTLEGLVLSFFDQEYKVEIE